MTCLSTIALLPAGAAETAVAAAMRGASMSVGLAGLPVCVQAVCQPPRV